MPGQIIYLKCDNCESHFRFQLGGDLRLFHNIQEYYRLAGSSRRRRRLNADERIEESFEFGVRQCPSCHNLFQTRHIRLADESGNVVESRTRSKCSRCKAETQQLNDFEEDITALPCPSCGTCSLAEEMDHILWD